MCKVQRHCSASQTNMLPTFYYLYRRSLLCYLDSCVRSETNSLEVIFSARYYVRDGNSHPNPSPFPLYRAQLSLSLLIVSIQCSQRSSYVPHLGQMFQGLLWSRKCGKDSIRPLCVAPGIRIELIWYISESAGSGRVWLGHLLPLNLHRPGFPSRCLSVSTVI